LICSSIDKRSLFTSSNWRYCRVCPYFAVLQLVVLGFWWVWKYLSR
jgi:hypothetical protein